MEKNTPREKEERVREGTTKLDVGNFRLRVGSSDLEGKDRYRNRYRNRYRYLFIYLFVFIYLFLITVDIQQYFILVSRTEYWLHINIIY